MIDPANRSLTPPCFVHDKGAERCEWLSTVHINPTPEFCEQQLSRRDQVPGSTSAAEEERRGVGAQLVLHQMEDVSGDISNLAVKWYDRVA